MDKNNVFRRFFPVHLADCFKERHALNVSYSPSYLNKTDISPAPCCNFSYFIFDLICNVRNNLDGFSEVVSPPFFGDHFLINLASCYVVVPGEFRVKEPLVVSEIQVNFASVPEHKNFPVLVRAHGTCIDIDVRVDLDSRNFITFIFQVSADGRDGDAFPKPAHHPTGNYDILHG
ncbi:hypothetical protein DSECCO2_497370 [anaerobic digester metagenome]